MKKINKAMSTTFGVATFIMLLAWIIVDISGWVWFGLLLGWVFFSELED